MHKKSSRNWVLGLLILTLPLTFTRAQKLNLEEYKLRFPGESKVILNMRTDYVVYQTGDSISMDINKHEESLCIDENAIMQANQSISYSGFYNLKSLTATTLIPVKSRYKTIKVKEFDTSDYRSPSVFYDDIKKISFKFPKVQPGAKTILDYSYHLWETRFVSPVYFNYYMPVESAEVTVTFPENVVINYKLFNCDSLKIAFTQEKKGTNIIYRWKLSNIPLIKPEGNAPEIAYYAAHIFIYIKEYTVNNKNYRVLSDVNDLFKWYQGFVGEINTQPEPTLKHLVDSLTSGIENETEKVKKLFFWVQDNIKYIAFEAGNQGFIPRDAELVCIRRYGDCKDMASLTSQMLNNAGIPAHLVWIGTRHIPYSYSELPLPATDNHMIAAYKSNGQWIFLDGTTGPHPFGYPSDMIQGKDAMINISPTKYEIAKIPIMSPEDNQITDSLFIRIEGKKLIGKGVSYFKGYSRYDMHHRIAQKDKTTQTTILKNYFEKGNNKFLIDNFSIVNLDERDKDLIISYNFNLADYAQIVGNEIFINLNMERPGQTDPIKDDRKNPVEMDYKKTIVNNVIFELPKGYKISYLPENSEYTNSLFNYKIEYKSLPNNIILTHSFTTNFLLLQKNDFEYWNKMLTHVKEAYKESINLTKITAK